MAKFSLEKIESIRKELKKLKKIMSNEFSPKNLLGMNYIKDVHNRIISYRICENAILVNYSRFLWALMDLDDFSLMKTEGLCMKTNGRNIFIANRHGKSLKNVLKSVRFRSVFNINGCVFDVRKKNLILDKKKHLKNHDGVYHDIIDDKEYFIVIGDNFSDRKYFPVTGNDKEEVYKKVLKYSKKMRGQ